jgi:diadenosine tetraphosphate (Ap4A) HIT family hydrolase
MIDNSSEDKEEGCVICFASPDDTTHILFHETRYWTIKLAPNQSLIGRCIIATKRHVSDLAGLTQEEIIELFDVVRVLQNALRIAFDATMFNWSCYMNHHYRESIPKPHVHWWVVPRYNHSVDLGGTIFDDPHFGSPYDHYRWLDVSIEVKGEIIRKIKDALTDEETLT